MDQSATSVRLRTHAKLNLFLRVVGRRPDGFHEIESIFQSVDLADDVVLLETSDGRVDVGMSFDTDVSGTAPALADDLTFRAAQRLIERRGGTSGVRVEVLKRIPIGGGLGGGSGNAAGVLTGLNDLWKLELEHHDLMKIAGLVGSDVPFCLSGGTALAMDRGGELTPLPAPRPLHVVLGVSSEPLSTSVVYAKWDAVGSTGEAGSAPMAHALGAGDVHAVASLLHNDLEAPAFALRPELAAKKGALLEAGALGAGLSGSGPTLFALAKDSDHARDIAARARARFDRVVVATSVTQGIERLD